mmetsp:Transcript_5050/g.14342  ORF Transcript_5050/g.14342 Transcript_5050/m.14342 type:complete len:185 (-) Transcript_5050:37-591(-)|eukprot:CAMPEP_0181045458 /NCGR_PEP_ID=MMETSP1070-20121207/13818_1 /TAXON_ID=265543 /ORGANISM="Minutocellus polymorphus, Strain NH13" /LENGTH=184 /DNA_ID=CAMNT_0023123987 /DNA_START=183 /DNA_END=737 /DNA_ORIENTATION=+
MSLVRHVKLRVPAGAARPGPAIGQALGPLGINMADFCKQFNDRTETMGYEKETPLTVQLSALTDRSFVFDVRSPPTSYLVKKAAGVDKGPESPNADAPVGFITPEAVYEIAKVKNADQHRWHLPLDGVARSVIGTARSIGIRVKESEDDQVTEEAAAAGGATKEAGAADGGDKKKKGGKKGKKK